MIGYRNYSQSDLRLFRVGAKVSNINHHSVSNLQSPSQQRSNGSVNNKIDTHLPNEQLQQTNQKRRSTSLTTKINFIYHQPLTPQKSFSLNNKYPQYQSQKIQQIQYKKIYKQKPKKFMNIISKNYLSGDVLNFIYGKDKTKEPKDASHKLGSIVKNKRETIEKQVISNSKVYDHLPARRFHGLIQTSGQPTFEHFPLSKIKRSGKSSRKSSTNNLLFPSNGKNYNEQQILISKIYQNQQNQPKETVNEEKKAQIHQSSPKPQEWNNTIKFNQIKLNNKHEQLGDTADTNPVHKTQGTGESIKSPNQQSMRNNQTQKISEFILCDQEIKIEDEENPLNQHQTFHHFSNQNQDNEPVNNNNEDEGKSKELESNQLVDEVPQQGVANEEPEPQDVEVKSADIQQKDNDSIANSRMMENTQQKRQSQQSENKDNEKIIYNIETSETLGCEKTQQIDHQNQPKFQLYDKLQESIQQLGKNIGDLSGKLSKISQSRNQQQHKKQQLQEIQQVKRKQRKLSLTSKCFSENVNKPITNTSEIKKEGKINLTLFPEELKQKEDLKKLIVEDEIAINVTYQARHHSHSKAFQLVQQEPVQFIEGEPQNEFLNLSYSRETQIVHQEIPKNQSSNKVAFIDHEKELGSLEIINHAHQNSLIGHSLSNIYINQYPQKELQKGNESLTKTKQYHYYSHKQYQSIYTGQKRNNIQQEIHESMQSIPQERVQKFLPHLTQNQFNINERERKIKEFYCGATTIQQPKSKKGIERVTKNMKGIQLGKHDNNSRFLTNNLSIRPQSKQPGTNNNGLNYEMYRTYRNRSGSKKYTLLGYDEKKEKIIELPYMEKPLNVKLDDELVHLPKYIKSKVYYLKG